MSAFARMMRCNRARSEFATVPAVAAHRFAWRVEDMGGDARLRGLML